MGADAEIKASLSMMVVATHYGFVANRGGFICCPFHQEKTPSLKLYDQPGRGFNCYGCGTTGSVIDFVMKLFNLTFPEAVRRIGSDFGIAVGGRPDWRETQRALKAAAERTRGQREYERVHAELVRTTGIIHAKRPQSIDEYWDTDNDFDPELADAIKAVTHLRYKLEQLEVAGFGRVATSVHKG